LMLAGNFLRRYDFLAAGYNFLNDNALPLSLGYHISTSPHYTYNNDDEAGHALIEDRGLSATLRGSLGELTFASISSFSNSGVRGGLDNDASDAPLGAIYSDQFIEAFTQEFQLLSSEQGPLHWIAGAYLYDSNAGSSNGVLITSEAPAPDVLLRARIRTVSVSAYGQATYDFSPQFALTVGARENRDSKTMLGRTTTIAAAGIELTDPRQKETWNNFSPKATLEYRPTDTSMLYASYTKGFKAGNFNLFSAGVVNPETLDAFEFGGTHKLNDNRLALDWSTFYYKYKNLQVDTIIPAGSGIGGTILETLNAASSKTYGVDFTGEAAATDRLHLTAGVSWLHAHFDSYPNAAVYAPIAGGTQQLGNELVSEDVSGRPVPYAPQWSANATARYVIPLGSRSLELSGSYQFVDNYSIEPSDRLQQASYSMIGARATFNVTDWLSIYGYGKNLLNEDVISGSIIAAVGDKVQYSDPRIVGIGFKAQM
jgi:iron complex outermembrane receptor protein